MMLKMVMKEWKKTQLQTSNNLEVFMVMAYTKFNPQ